MKKRLHLPFLFVLITATLSAGINSAALGIGNAISPKEVNVDGRYSMMLPDYLTPSTDLNDEASLQYQNVEKEVYIIVIDESAEDFKNYFQDSARWDKNKSLLENYAREQLSSIRSNMTKVTKEERLPMTKTKSGEAIVYNMSGTSEGVDDAMGFKVAFVHGRLNLYMIMTWTFDKSFPQYDADMTAMIVSFKELSGDIAALPPAGLVKVNGQYALQVAEGMTEDTSLNSEAALQYSYYEQELYVIVINEPTTEFVKVFKEINDYQKDQSPLDNYTRVQRTSLASGLTHIKELGDITSKK